MNEHQIIQACSSPYVLRSLDSFETQDHLYLVQEYLEGMTLSDFLYNNAIEDVRALTKLIVL
jgi:serine/threonine protein kinase